MNNNNKELYVVDENGKILETIDPKETYVKLESGDRILKKKTTDYLTNLVDIKYRFMKINPVSYSEVALKYSIFPILTKYIGYMDNILEYSNGVKVQRKDIKKICNVSTSTVKRQISGMIKDDVIHIVRKKGKTYITVNPFICYKGKKIYVSLYEEFKLSHWRNKTEVVK